MWMTLLVLAQSSFATLAEGSLARIAGTTTLTGLWDSVEVIRDRWGVPHIYARNTQDLFFAQGYVQAQDRLWQLDMYRRIWTGELAELLGPEYLGHDRLVRLLRYRGPWDNREWTSYHPEGRRIFEAFAAGVNAFIAQAGDNLPVEFKLTGLKPGRWTAELSLLRTQTAVPLGDARAELNLARNVAQFGVEEANRRARPSPHRELVVPDGFDPASVSQAVVDALGGLRQGMPRIPLLPEYRSWPDALPRENRGAQEDAPGSNNWVLSGRLTASGKVLLANDPHRNVSNPSIRYIVHLEAPGWSLIGATEAPLPGVMIGHNGRIAWGLTIVGTDQADVYVETLHPDRDAVRYQNRWEPLRIVRDTIRVLGQAPVVVTHKFSRHGPVFYEDSAKRRAWVVRSTMHVPGSAGYLSALRYHAVGTCRDFLAAQRWYRAPTENMICGDRDGGIAWQASAASPRRPNWHGRLPVPGDGGYEWTGFREDLPRELDPARGWIATANHDIHPPGYDPPLFFKTGPQTARYDRVAALITQGSRFTLADMARMQHDAFNGAAFRDLDRFRGWTAGDSAQERARALLAGWDGWQRKESAAAALWSFVPRTGPGEAALRTGLGELVAAQGADPAGWRWGRVHRSELPHPLLAAYDIPAVERSGGAGTVAATGATYRQVVDFADLDASLATNFPGQSGQPGSPFYANLAESFGRGEYFPLSFSRAAVERNAAYRLRLVPLRTR